MRGGVDAIYDEVPRPLGLSGFAPVNQARGRMFSARHRAGRESDPVIEPVIAEGELYAETPVSVTE